MELHGFVCSVVNYDGPEQMTNTAKTDAVLWNTIDNRNGRTYPVTSVAHLNCVKTNASVIFALVNGRTSRLSLAASGSMR
jgi:hypothetical protein